MKWTNKVIKTDDGKQIEAQAPVIVSASRATDIPAFYSDWFVDRLSKGYVKWKNPFNGTFTYVSFANTKLIVFWSKNPKPLINHLEYIKTIIPNYYFQFTLNDYENENLELKVPPLTKRIETFIELSEKIGRDKVVWRFDPLILTDKITIDILLQRIDNIARQLKNYTNKLVISFADIRNYKKVQINLKRAHINYKEFTDQMIYEFAAGLKEVNANFCLEVGTCAERVELENFGIMHNKCIDENLIIKLFPHDKLLMDFLGVEFLQRNLFSSDTEVNIKKNNKDSGQREFCGCIISKDIGQYNTCPHLCEYCYANSSKELAVANYKRHRENPSSELIMGD